MQFEEITLKNGLNTLLINAPGNTSASVQIWFKAGSALENYENEGIAHFLEHMFFKGTKTRPGAQIAHAVESFGGEINAFTSFDYTCYYINAPCTHVPETVDILMDMVANPMFLEEDLIPERGVVFEEYRRSQDNPNQYSFQQIQKNIFTGPYSHPILGREETIKTFSKEQLNEFRNNFYNLSNTTLVVAADLRENKDEIVNIIEKYKLPSGPKSKFPKFELNSKPNISIHKKDVRMSTLTLLVSAPEMKHENSIAEDVALSTFGHGESSRFYQGMVMDQSLANASATSTMFFKHGGVHFIRVSCPPENLKKVCKKVTSIFNETLKNGFTREEIKKIKNQYIASKVYEKESLESFAFNLGYGLAQTGNPKHDEDFIEKAKKLTGGQINKAFKDVLTKSFHINLQIPNDQDESSAKKTLVSFQKDLAKISKSQSKKSVNKKATRSKFDPQLEVEKLKNGITLLYRHNPMTPTFVLHSYLKGGLTEETNNNNGIHNILTGVLAKGYKGKKYEQLKYDLDEKSAHLNCFSGKNAYGATLHGQSTHTKDLFSHFFNSLLNPTFENRFIKHEKELTLRTIESNETDPIKQCFKKVNSLMFNKHPYAKSTLGTKETIKKINKKKIQELHSKNIKNKEILISYCGDLEKEEVLKLLAPYLEKLKPRKEKKLTAKKYKPLTGNVHKIDFDREQTQIFFGIPVGKLESKDNLYLKILTTILQGQSSELFVDVRDRKGLCYAAQPIHFTALEGGYWGIYMASGHDKVDAAIEALKEIIEKYKTSGIAKEDFLRVKRMIEGQTLLNVQTNEDYANIYSVPTLQGQGIDYYHKKNKQVFDMKYDDFIKGIKKILSRKWTTVLVGKNLN